MSRRFGNIRQIAWVVADIDQAMSHWSRNFGIGPFFIKREIELQDFVYRGRGCVSPKISIALANSGELQIELLVQHNNHPSIYKEFIDSGGRGLQHIASWFDRKGFDQKRQDLLDQGMTIAQSGTIPSSGVRLCYFDTETVDGSAPIFEIADLLEPGQLERVMRIKTCAERWDGQDAVIEVSE